MASTDTTYTPVGSDVLHKLPAVGKSVYTSGTWAINTGKPQAIGYMVQIVRGASVLATANPTVTLVNGVLTIASTGGGYTVTAADVANWVVF